MLPRNYGIGRFAKLLNTDDKKPLILDAQMWQFLLGRMQKHHKHNSNRLTEFDQKLLESASKIYLDSIGVDQKLEDGSDNPIIQIESGGKIVELTNELAETPNTEEEDNNSSLLSTDYAVIIRNLGAVGNGENAMDDVLVAMGGVEN